MTLINEIRNQEFENASPERKRVMIAEDALNLLELEVLEANRGKWAVASKWSKDTECHTQVQSLLHKDSGFVCKVCAVGSLLMGVVRFKNKLTVSELLDLNNSFGSLTGLSQDIREYFDFRQLSLIEYVYELGQGWTTINEIATLFSLETADKALEFANKANSSDERLRIILNNIIQNNGEFKL